MGQLRLRLSEEKNMVSKLTKEHDRRTLLANYLYGVSNLFITGVGIGGFSPLITNQEMNIYNYLSVTFGIAGVVVFAYCANRVMKYNDK